MCKGVRYIALADLDTKRMALGKAIVLASTNNEIPTIRGVLLLDDIVGFLGPDDVERFAMPYLKRAFTAIDSDVRFFHNDAHGLCCAPYLAAAGINLGNDYTRVILSCGGGLPPGVPTANIRAFHDASLTEG